MKLNFYDLPLSMRDHCAQPPRGLVAVYGLHHPDTGDLRYVGKTQHSVAKRVWAHLDRAKKRVSNTHLDQWLRSLPRPPLCSTLGLFTYDEWQHAERAWIADLRAEGVDLTNTTPGGEGWAGWHHTAETKARLSAASKGRKRTREAIEASAASHRGRKRSPETCQRISEAKRGKPWSDAMRLARTGPS